MIRRNKTCLCYLVLRVIFPTHHTIFLIYNDVGIIETWHFSDTQKSKTSHKRVDHRNSYVRRENQTHQRYIKRTRIFNGVFVLIFYPIIRGFWKVITTVKKTYNEIWPRGHERWLNQQFSGKRQTLDDKCVRGRNITLFY